MSGSLNKVQLIGYIGLKPKAIASKDGTVFYSVSIATHERLKKGGEWETMTEWHQLLFFGAKTKLCEHLQKGSYVFIEGTLRQTLWTDNAGTQHRQVNIIVSRLEFLDKKAVNHVMESAEPSISPEMHLANLKAILGENASEEKVPF